MNRLRAIHIPDLKEGHFLKKQNPSCYDDDPNQYQEGPAFRFQLFNLKPFLFEISHRAGMQWERRTSDLGFQR